MWIVDVAANLVHVHADPVEGGYREVRSLGLGDVLVPTAVEDVRLPVDEVLV